MRQKWIFVLPAAILGLALFIFVGGEVVQLLWNWLLPPLFGWREVTFWQALGLLALCRILFGGFVRHGSGGSHLRHRLRERMAERMGERMGKRWERMTPEERERFRQGMRARCGFNPIDSDSKAPSEGKAE
jgi:hypothetical protein